MKLTHLIRSLVVSLPLVVLAVGCLNLSPVTDHTRYFLLQPTVDPAEPGSTLNGPALGVARVRVPEYLKPTWLAIRASDTEIRYAEADRWGEPLDRGVQRVLADNLALLLSTDRIRMSVWGRDDVDVELHLTLRRFEADTQGQVTLEARWRISGDRSANGHTLIRNQGPDPTAHPADSVQAMSHALADLARAIAADISSRSTAGE